jgi:hypothetical protein
MGCDVKSFRTDPRNHAPQGDERIRTAVCELGYESVYDLLRVVTDALQETRILAVVSWEGDHWYAESAGLDARAILEQARDALEDAETALGGSRDA